MGKAYPTGRGPAVEQTPPPPGADVTRPAAAEPVLARVNWRGRWRDRDDTVTRGRAVGWAGEHVLVELVELGGSRVWLRADQVTRR